MQGPGGRTVPGVLEAHVSGAEWAGKGGGEGTGGQEQVKQGLVGHWEDLSSYPRRWDPGGPRVEEGGA